MAKTRRPGELPPLPPARASSSPVDPVPVAEPGPIDTAASGAPAAAGGSSRSGGATRDPMIGRVLADRYKIVSEMATGGMATVYRAEHLLLRKPVAVKVLLPELTLDADMAGRFEREAIAA